LTSPNLTCSCARSPSALISYIQFGCVGDFHAAWGHAAR
jgi:hypothetical protein